MPEFWEIVETLLFDPPSNYEELMQRTLSAAKSLCPKFDTVFEYEAKDGKLQYSVNAMYLTRSREISTARRYSLSIEWRAAGSSDAKMVTLSCTPDGIVQSFVNFTVTGEGASRVLESDGKCIIPHGTAAEEEEARIQALKLLEFLVPRVCAISGGQRRPGDDPGFLGR